MLPRSGFCSEGVDFLPLRESALTTSSPATTRQGPASSSLPLLQATVQRHGPLEVSALIISAGQVTKQAERSCFPRSLSSSGADLTLTPQTSAPPDSHDRDLTFQMLRFLAAPSHHALLLTLPADLTAPAPSAQCPLFVPAPPPPDPAVLGAPLHGEPCWPHEG